MFKIDLTKLLLVFSCVVSVLHQRHVVAEDCPPLAAEPEQWHAELSNRSVSACCREKEVSRCIPALKKRVDSILNTADDGRKLLDLPFVLRTILALGSSGDVQEMKELYAAHDRHNLLSILFAEAFMDYRLAMVMKGLVLTADEIFPPEELAGIEIPAFLVAAPADLKLGYRQYTLLKAAADKTAQCSELSPPDGTSAQARQFWPDLAAFLLEDDAGKRAQLFPANWFCHCARGSKIHAQIVYGLRLMKLIALERQGIFVRAYALAWQQDNFRNRRACLYSKEKYFNSWADQLFARAGINPELIYTGALLSGEESLDYETLVDNKTQSTRMYLEKALPFMSHARSRGTAQALLGRI